MSGSGLLLALLAASWVALLIAANGIAIVRLREVNRHEPAEPHIPLRQLRGRHWSVARRYREIRPEGRLHVWYRLLLPACLSAPFLMVALAAMASVLVD